MEGHPEFCELSKKHIFGSEGKDLNKISTIQTISGTGALNVILDFIRTFMPSEIYVPSPTWATHYQIIQNKGLKFKEYPYFNSKFKNFDCQGMLDYLNTLPPKSIILLHPAAHNPTGN